MVPIVLLAIKPQPLRPSWKRILQQLRHKTFQNIPILLSGQPIREQMETTAMSQTIPASNFTLIRPGYIRFIYLLGLLVLCSLTLIVSFDSVLVRDYLCQVTRQSNFILLSLMLD
jgi:hypothetical protein